MNLFTKSLIICLVLMAFAIQSYAQSSNYRSLEWDIVRFGYVIPSGEGISGGVSISSEPRFNITNNISVGLRYQLDLFSTDIDDDSFDLGSFASYALVGDYYFNEVSSSRPFAGLGFGSFSGGDVTFTDGGGVSTTVDGISSIGVFPRVGYELGHVRFSLEYNYLFKENTSNYLGIHVGFTLGGGVK